MTCPLQTERSGHLFRCTLRRGHPGDHVWWLAAPTWGPVPVWTAETLIEDDWGNGKDALTCGNDGEHGFDEVGWAGNEAVPASLPTTRDPASPVEED